MKNLQKTVLRLYMAAVIVFGFSAMVLLLVFYPVHNFPAFLFFTVLVIVAETQTVQLPNHQSVSVSSAIVLSVLLTFGPGAAALSAALAICGSITRDGKKTYHLFNTPVRMTLFNIGDYVISIALTGITYVHLGGGTIGGGAAGYGDFTRVLHGINQNALPLLASVFVFIFVNGVMVAAYFSLSSGAGFLKVWLSNLLWPVASLFFICLFGIIIAGIYVAYGWFPVVLFFAPLILARYIFIVYKNLQQSYIQTITCLASAIEAKDKYTIGHSRRVEEYCAMIAREMHLSYRRSETLRYASLLHDIGKIGVREDLLNKPGKLSTDEWKEMHNHPLLGAHIIEDVEFLSKAAEIVKTHHEWLNGKGYPMGLTAGELSLESMILSVADSYDAMTSTRPYSHALPAGEAFRELYRKAGTQFSPEVVEAFERAMRKEEKEDHAV